jgi:hypothetical protein
MTPQTLILKEEKFEVETNFATKPSPRDYYFETTSARPVVKDPFLFLDENKLTIKGVTYGTFAADENGDLFPPREQVRKDFELMREAKINTIRTYTAPPDWLLIEARRQGLRILIAIYWESHNCDFDSTSALKKAKNTVKQAVDHEMMASCGTVFSMGSTRKKLRGLHRSMDTPFTRIAFYRLDQNEPIAPLSPS